jgi:hypothetical protein
MVSPRYGLVIATVEASRASGKQALVRHQGAAGVCERAETADVDYDASPSRIDVPVDVEEVKELLAGDLRDLSKNQHWLAHLLTRVGNTIFELRRQIYQLHRDVQQMSITRSSAGAATTLSPLDAVKFLTPEQFASVADEMTKSSIAAAEKARREAKADGADALRVVSEVKLLLGSICDDPTTPRAIADRLAGVLARVSGRADALAPSPGASSLDDIFGAQ